MLGVGRGKIVQTRRVVTAGCKAGVSGEEKGCGWEL